ncbi:MAG: hypothetical protein Q9191_007841, partial [Dirinaria sp. TL-2023a]
GRRQDLDWIAQKRHRIAPTDRDLQRDVRERRHGAQEAAQLRERRAVEGDAVVVVERDAAEAISGARQHPREFEHGLGGGVVGEFEPGVAEEGARGELTQELVCVCQGGHCRSLLVELGRLVVVVVRK